MCPLRRPFCADQYQRTLSLPYHIHILSFQISSLDVHFILSLLSKANSHCHHDNYEQEKR